MANSAPPLLLPRGLIFLASLWLIGSWLMSIGIQAPIQPSSASYTPAVRDMLLSITTGLVLAWPLMRVSQSPSPYPMKQTLLDIAVLLGLVQVVVWPLRLITAWTPLRTASIDATLAGWTILAGAFIASSIGTNRTGPRVLAVSACAAMCVLGPMLSWLSWGNQSAATFAQLSPITAVRELAEGGGLEPTIAQWSAILVLHLAAILSWVATGLGKIAQDRRGTRQAA